MSQRALLLAVRDYLRSELEYTDSQCEVTFDGQPPAVAGERFVAIHAGSWTGDEETEGLEEEYGIEVTVSVKAGRVPRDRIGTNLLVGPTGESLDNHLEDIRAALHLDKGAYPVLALANATIGASENGFVVPLRFRDGGKPTEKDHAWFGVAPPDVKGLLPPAGIAQTLTFGGAKRVQVVEEQS